MFPSTTEGVGPEPAHSLRKLRIASHVHPPFAGCNYLVSVETEAAHISYRTGSSPLVLSAMRFRRILDDSDSQLLLEFEQWVHVRRMSIDMNRHDGLGFVSHFLPNSTSRSPTKGAQIGMVLVCSIIGTLKVLAR